MRELLYRVKSGIFPQVEIMKWRLCFMKRTFLICFVMIVFAAVLPAAGRAEVNVSITLPGLFFPAPPPLVVVPGTYVYYPPEADIDVFFYGGYWYRPYRGGWYIGDGYNGPWRAVGRRRVPPPLFEIRPGYRSAPRRYGPVPYYEVRRNWRSWERERYWDHEREGRRGREDWDRRDHDRGEGHGRGRHGG